MEKIRLRVRNEPKRGHIWELHLFPHHPRHQLREADARILGSSSVPEVVLWLRKVSEVALARADEPEPISAGDFGPEDEPRWLRLEDGMRLALAFGCARYLVKAEDRRRFREELEKLPSEVVLYWFTLCYYGYRQAAGRAALRTLLTHEEPDERAYRRGREVDARRRRKRTSENKIDADDGYQSSLFGSSFGKDVVRERLGEYVAQVRHGEDGGDEEERPQ